MSLINDYDNDPLYQCQLNEFKTPQTHILEYKYAINDMTELISDMVSLSTLSKDDDQPVLMLTKPKGSKGADEFYEFVENVEDNIVPILRNGDSVIYDIKMGTFTYELNDMNIKRTYNPSPISKDDKKSRILKPYHKTFSDETENWLSGWLSQTGNIDVDYTAMVTDEIISELLTFQHQHKSPAFLTLYRGSSKKYADVYTSDIFSSWTYDITIAEKFAGKEKGKEKGKGFVYKANIPIELVLIDTTLLDVYGMGGFPEEKEVIVMGGTFPVTILL